MNFKGLSEASKAHRIKELGRALAGSTGVLHLGAHLGEEAKDYAAAAKRAVWVEALPHIHARLELNLKDFKDQRSFRVFAWIVGHCSPLLFDPSFRGSTASEPARKTEAALRTM